MFRPMSRKKQWLLGGGCAALLAGGGVLAVLAVIVLVVALPYALRGPLVEALDRELDAAAGTDVSLGGVDVSLFSTLPRATLRVRDLRVASPAPFEGTDLFAASRLDVGVDLLAALGGRLEIERVVLEDAELTVLVDKKGRTNVPGGGGGGGSSGGGGSGVTVVLDALEIDDFTLTYEDRSAGMRAKVEHLDLTASGRASDAGVRFETEAGIEALTAHASGVTWLDRAVVDADLALEWDARTGTLTLGDNTVAVNALPLAFSGTVTSQAAATGLDLQFAVKDTSFKTLLSLVPSAFTQDFAGVTAGGTLRLAGHVKGDYVDADHLPSFLLDLGVADGSFRYPSLPAGVDAIAVDLRVEHPGGAPDAAVIDLKELSLRTAGAPIRLVARVTHPVSDPDVDAKLVGTLDLAALAGALPAEPGSPPPSGRIDADVEVRGRASQFASGADPTNVKAAGTFRATDLRYRGEGMPEVTIRRAGLTLTPAVADLEQADLRYADSDLVLSGRLEGLLAWLLVDDAPLKGGMSLQSKRLDLRPFSTDEEEPEPEPEASNASAIVPVPGNVDFEFDAAIGHLITDTFEMRDVSGKIVVRDSAVRMAPIRGQMLGGEVTLEGTYLAPTARSADVDLAVTAVRLDLADTVREFDTLKRIAPLLEGVSGRFDTGFGMKGRLNRDGTPDLSILSSQGHLAPAGTTLRPKAMGSVSSALKNGDADALVLTGATIGYALREGQLRLQPSEVRLGSLPATLSGTAGLLDRTMDLKLAVSVPAGSVAGAKKVVGDALDVTVRITGGWDDPKVKVSLDGADVEEVVEAVVDEALARVQAEVEKLLAEAEAAADALRAEAKKQGDKLVKEAKGNPVAEAGAKEAAKLLEKEADKAADKVLAEARKKADELLAAAKGAAGSSSTSSAGGGGGKAGKKKGGK